MRHLSFKAENCTGCRMCELICSASHTKSFNTKRSAISIEAFFPQPATFKAKFCLHCKDPSCVEACPVGALEKTKSEVVIFNKTICTACGECVRACPYEGIRLDRNGLYPIKCDLCGGNPECVKICGRSALTFEGDHP